MKQFLNLALTVACAATLLSGCTGKNGDPGPTGATGATGAAGSTGASGQNLTGNIVGFVNPVDGNGTSLNKSGVVVSVNGANPAITATTNADGRYELTSVRNGTYNLTYTRADLPTFRRYGIGHVGGDQPTYLNTNTISQASAITVPNFSASTTQGSTIISLSMTLASPTAATIFPYAVFASTSSTVNPATATLLFTSSISTSFTTTSINTSSSISRNTLANAGFAPGTAVYLAIFGSTSIVTSYPDPTTGRSVYPSLNSTGSQVVAVIAP